MQFLIPSQYKAESGVYAIRNDIDNRLYVGSALNFKVRYYSHRGLLHRNSHHSTRLQCFYNEHGADIFRFELLEIVQNPQQLSATEQLWINATNAASIEAGFNNTAIVVRRKGEALTVHHTKGSFNARFVELLNRLRLNSTSFSRRVKITASVITNITGYREGKPSFEVLEKISTAFPDVSMEWLLRGEGAMLRSEATELEYKKKFHRLTARYNDLEEDFERLRQKMKQLQGL